MKKSKVSILVTFVLAISMVVCVWAGDVKYGAKASNDKYNTKGEYEVAGKYTVNTPLIGTCSMKTKGTAKLTYKKNGTKYTHKTLSNKAVVSVGGIGGCSISLSGMDITVDSKTATFEVKTDDWDYAIYSQRARMLSYSEQHTITYDLKRNGESKATVTMGTVFKWGI